MKPGELKVGCLAWVIRAATPANIGKIVRVLDLQQGAPGKYLKAPDGRLIRGLDSSLLAMVEAQAGKLQVRLLSFGGVLLGYEEHKVSAIRAQNLLPFPEDDGECDEVAQSTTIKESA